MAAASAAFFHTRGLSPGLRHGQILLGILKYKVKIQLK